MEKNPRESLDELTLLAAGICRVPSAFIILFAKDHLHLKYSNGLGLREILHLESLCRSLALPDVREILVIKDIHLKKQQNQNPRITNPLSARFFAAAPLFDKEGDSVGALCLTDRQPHSPSGEQLEQLRLLASQAAAQLCLKEERDAALSSKRSKSAFFANVSHEIRTPMNGIIGMTELLLNTPLEPVQREYLETIRQGSDALLEIVNDTLDLAKFESGKIRLEQVEFDPREVIAATVELLTHDAHQKNLKIAAVVEEKVPATLRGDPGRLRQILTNLIGNAVKFTEKGEIDILVRTENMLENETRLRFTVRDTGIGIKECDLKKLFQPFEQIEQPESGHRNVGTGLGLFISKQIVELLNGKISVNSRPGRGSEFSFTAQFEYLAALDQTKDQDRVAPESGALGLLENRRILIADPTPSICRTLQSHCRSWGMTVAIARSGTEVLDQLLDASAKSEPFDFTLIDTNLTGFEGFALARHIKKEAALRDTTRIILTTAYGERGDGITAAELGIDGYLTKPLNKSQLLACLTEISGKEAGDVKDDLSRLITRHSLREAKTKILNLPVRNEQMPNILIVDDNEINRRLISSQLKEIGLKADSAKGGIEALRKTDQTDYDLILMDCQMPQIDGFQATHEIRRREHLRITRGEIKRGAIIVAVTAHSLVRELEKCFRAGMNDYLIKPLKLKELTAVIDFWAQKSFSDTTQQFDQTAATPELSLKESESFSGAELDQEFFELYMTESGKHLWVLENSFGQKDFQAIAFAGHALRGNSLSVGFQNIARLSARIETAAREKDLTGIKQNLTEIKRLFRELPGNRPKGV